MSLANLGESESAPTGDINRLENLQDDVLRRLDELNEQIEELLSTVSSSKPLKESNRA